MNGDTWEEFKEYVNSSLIPCGLMVVVVVLEAIARSVDACKSSFLWMLIDVIDLCSLRVS